jgi:hypothetical protein
MEPVTLILAALAAGASAGIGDAASQAIKDAYTGLKTLIKRRFAGSAKAQEIFAEHEADPETYEKPLAKQLEATGANGDAAIVQAAERLLVLADKARVQTKYNVQVRGGKVGIIGDHAHVETLNM